MDGLAAALALRWLDEHLSVSGAMGQELAALRQLIEVREVATPDLAMLETRLVELEARLTSHEVVDMAEHVELAEDVAEVEQTAEAAEAEILADEIADEVAEELAESEQVGEVVPEAEPSPEQIVAELEQSDEQREPSRTPWLARKIGG